MTFPTPQLWAQAGFVSGSQGKYHRHNTAKAPRALKLGESGARRLEELPAGRVLVSMDPNSTPGFIYTDVFIDNFPLGSRCASLIWRSLARFSDVVCLGRWTNLSQAMVTCMQRMH
jgi:hypothetical protein